MTRTVLARGLTALICSTIGFAWAATPAASTDPLAAIDMNRNAIIADIVQGFDGDRAALAKRLSALRADRLLSASLASTRESLESILVEAEKSRGVPMSRASSKALGSPNSDLVYTPLTPCRLIDTRGFGAPIVGGPFAPDERRAYAPNGLCNLPTSGVATVLLSFTTQNLTPASGGYLSMIGPGAPVTTSVDIFNVGSEWSASSTAVASGAAAQFDVFVSTANAQLVVDVVGYFAPPQGTVVKSIVAGTGLTGGTITDTGTIAIATAFQLPQACTNGQIAQSNGAGVWSCVAPSSSGGGTITGVTASAPLASSGGNIPDISLNGVVSVANGGTGRATLDANGVVYGLGPLAVGTTVGMDGQVLTGTAGAPAWTSSPYISGNLSLATVSDGSGGSIFKGGAPFIHNAGTSNTFLGVNAGNLTIGGTANTGVGKNALSGDGTGFNNTAIGSNALANNTDGLFNTAAGTNALFSNQTGVQNTATGFNALFSTTSAGFNTANGSGALQNTTTGDSNTAAGYHSLQSNTEGSSNNGNGANALFSNTTGSFNTGTGQGALTGNTTGSHNIALGYNAGQDLTIGDYNIVLGNSGVADEANTIRIGDANQTRAFIGGIRNVTTGIGDGVAVLIDGDGQLGTLNSSRRFKDDIADMDSSSSALMALRPVTFHYKTDRDPAQRKLQYGLIAEEVATVYPGLIAYSANGEAQTVMYQYLPAMLLNEFQKQQRTIDAQARHVARLEQAVAEVADLKQQVARMVRLLEMHERAGTITAGLK